MWVSESEREMTMTKKKGQWKEHYRYQIRRENSLRARFFLTFLPGIENDENEEKVELLVVKFWKLRRRKIVHKNFLRGKTYENL